MRGKTQNVAVTLEQLCEWGSSEFLVLPLTFINAMGLCHTARNCSIKGIVSKWPLAFSEQQRRTSLLVHHS